MKIILKKSKRNPNFVVSAKFFQIEMIVYMYVTRLLIHTIFDEETNKKILYVTYRWRSNLIQIENSKY